METVQLWQVSGSGRGCDIALLTWETRQILGLHTSCTQDPAEIADLLGYGRQRVRSVLAEVKRCDHPLLRGVLRNGLPIHGAVDLPPATKVRCKKCRALLSAVPCIPCGMDKQSSVMMLTDQQEASLPRSPYATDTPPGSPDRIATMRFRAAMGYGVFNPNDTRV